jgi:hypothetical protein
VVTPAPAAALSLELATARLIVGQTTQATATPRDGRGAVLAGRAVAFATSDTAVATVSPAGVVTATGPGTASVVATVEGVSAAAALTVAPAAVATVTLAPESPTILINRSTRVVATARDADGRVLPGRAVTYASSDPAFVAAVDAAGVVTGRGPGSATITATVDGQSGSTTVTVEQDMTPPTLASLAFTPAPVHVTAADGVVEAAARLVDAGYGAGFVALTAYGPAGPAGPSVSCRQFLGATVAPAPSATLRCALSVPRGSPPGTWTVGSVMIGDAASNTAVLTTADLVAAGVTSTFTVENNDWPDTAPPSLLSFALAPNAVDVRSGPRDVVLMFRLRDAGSGVQSAGATVEGPQGSSGAATCTATRLLGTAGEADYRCAVTIPQGSAHGTWTVRAVTAADAAGNVRTVRTADLTAAGYPSTFTVADPAGPPGP